MKNFMFWMLAFLITLGAAVYQRMTGPTYDMKGKVQIEDTEIKYRLPRTHVTDINCDVSIKTEDENVQGFIKYQRYKSPDEWTRVEMTRSEGLLTASLPFQPPAGKLAYHVTLVKGEKPYPLTEEDPVVIRFKGAVPMIILLPHVLIMFLAMLFSTRAGIEALRPNSNPRKLAIWTTGLLIAGGMILGPLVQQFAFGALWTGFPFGTDLTDNKTLIALIAWIIALIMGRKGKPARAWVLGASVILMAIYLIPHSLLGSELDYSQINKP
ncbi:hypothetical protein ACFLT9_08875 [Acidobacteriota bacterium]